MVKAIIFDCFGVLVGSSFKEIFRQAGGNLEADEPFVDDVLSAANSGFISSREMHQRVADHLGIPLDEWRQFVIAREQPNEELLTYVRQLKNTYKLAILSNANHGVLPRKLNPDQLAIFDTVVASADVGFMKPAREIYQLTADKLGVELAACVFIDDGQNYCEAAQAAGMQAIWYRNLDQLRRDLEPLLAKSS